MGLHGCYTCTEQRLAPRLGGPQDLGVHGYVLTPTNQRLFVLLPHQTCIEQLQWKKGMISARKKHLRRGSPIEVLDL